MAPVATPIRGSLLGPPEAIRSLTDAELLAEQAAIGRERRLLDARAAAVAAEIARRSETVDGTGLAVTVDAAGPTATGRHRGRRCTIRSPGAAGAAPASTTGSRCAHSTICSRTTRDGASNATAPSTG